MEASDIFLKLVPFTAKESEKVIFTTNLDIGEWIVAGVEIALLFFFLFFLSRLLISYVKDNRVINTIQNEVDSFSKLGMPHYSNIENNLSKNPLAKHLWHEFDEALVKQPNRIDNSLDAEYFFNRDTLATHVGSKFYAAIPGILLGVGLLGTFLALYVALVELNLDDDDLKNSIKVFIAMVGVKFTASVWGILLSVLFTIFEKGIEGRLDRRITNLQKTVDHAFIRQTAEQNLFKIANESTQQTQSLNGLAETLTQKISEQFNPIISQMNSNLAEMPNHIARAISDSLNEPLSVLKSNVDNAANQQTESLEKIIGQFVGGLDQATGEHAKQSQTMMHSLTEQLANLIEQMNVANEKQESIYKERDGQIDGLLESIANQQSEIIKEQSKMLDTIAIRSSEIMSQISQEMEKINHFVKLSSEELAQLPEIFEKLTAISQTLADFSTSMTSVSDRFNISTQEMLKVEEKIGTNIKLLNETSATTEKTSEASKLIVETAEKGVKEIAEAYQSLIQGNEKNLDDLGDSMSKWLQDYDRLVKSTMQSSLGEVQSSLTGFANSVSNSISELEDMINDLGEKRGDIN